MVESDRNDKQQQDRRAQDYLDLWERNLSLIAIEGTRAIPVRKPE